MVKTVARRTSVSRLTGLVPVEPPGKGAPSIAQVRHPAGRIAATFYQAQASAQRSKAPAATPDNVRGAFKVDPEAPIHIEADRLVEVFDGAFDLRQEPGAGKPHAGICAGGGWQQPSLPRPPQWSRKVAKVAMVFNGRGGPARALCAAHMRSSPPSELNCLGWRRQFRGRA